jgi:hypothetical protein
MSLGIDHGAMIASIITGINELGRDHPDYDEVCRALRDIDTLIWDIIDEAGEEE